MLFYRSFLCYSSKNTAMLLNFSIKMQVSCRFVQVLVTFWWTQGTKFCCLDLNSVLWISACLSIAISLLNWLSFQIIYYLFVPCFLSLSCGETTLKVLHLLDQSLSCILSTWPNHYSPLSNKHFFILVNFNLVLCSSAKILSSGLPYW